MDHDPWRLTVQLTSKRMLKQYAEWHRLSGRGLAAKAKVSPAIVGHLMSGRRSTCNLNTARAIEEALSLPPDVLFVASPSRVADNGRQQAKAS